METKELDQLASTLQLLTLHNQSADVVQMRRDFKKLIRKNGDNYGQVTGFMTNVADGDYTEVWYTTDNAPYLVTATYHKIK